VSLACTVNGEPQELAIRADEMLLEALRDRLGLTGAKRGCNQGVCGACTVLIDGKAMRSCLAFAADCGGRDIVTVEGLAPAPGALSPVQRALVEAGAVQCGFCTPGMAIALTELLGRVARPTKGEVREAISGNLCRCSGYVKIVEAALSAAAAGRP
jgi:carbon-monoxide dehydrogenase small subunit